MQKTVQKIILLISAGIFFLPVIAFGKTDFRYTDDGFKIKKDGYWIKFGGTLMWDVDSASDVFWDSEDNDGGWQTHSELRRARLKIKAKFADNWKAKLQFNYTGNDESVKVKDAYMEYSGWQMMGILVGQANEPFGLEAMTTLKNLSFIERSMVTDAFKPGRNIGISLNSDTDILFWQLGVYEAQDREDDGDTYAVTGRLAVVPWKTDTGFFHLGMSGSYRDFDGEEFEIKESAEIHTADNIIYSDEIDTDHLLLYGMETVFCTGSFSFQAEYMMADVNAVEGDDDATFAGYYLAASWFLTGETRPFKKGVWGRVKPEAAYGAWELATRYSCLDAAENGQGTSADAYTLGLNWHINSNVRLMTDYIHLWVTDESTDAETTGDAVSFRFQFVF
jgi:phosphate-selective porin OprO and OprP